MAKLMILGVALATLIASISAAAVEPGGIIYLPDSKFPEILPELKTVLASIDAVPPTNISFWATGVVPAATHGALNYVVYENKIEQTCEAFWVDPPRISKKPQYVKNKCYLFPIG